MKLHIPHPAGESPESFLRFIEELRERETGWLIQPHGSLRTRPGSIHVHINSADKKQRGTLELTWDPKLKGSIEIKIASNRNSAWAEEALEKVKKLEKIITKKS